MGNESRRDGYISARKRDLAAALTADADAPAGEGAALRELFTLLSAVLHHEAQAQAEALKDLYEPLDPDAPAARRDTSFAAFDAFEGALADGLKRANFEEIDPNDVRALEATRLLTGLKVKTSLAGIRRVRYFARGAHEELVERKNLLGRKVVQANVFSDVIVLVGFKSTEEIMRADRRVFSAMRRGVRPGAALVKHFRNVAMAELVTLHPGAKPSMQNRDRVVLGVPAVAAGVPVLLNLWPALMVLFTVLTAYFGAGAVIEDSELKRALAAMSGLVALVAFMMRQRLKLEAQTLRYQKQLADTVYFRNIANNAGVLDLLVGAGEEQDVKEAFLAYWALQRAGRALSKDEIDAAAEAFLRERMNLEVDFEIQDALGKLERLGLVQRHGDSYAAAAPAEALARLDAAWDNYFKFAATASSPT